jgi:hypothetical protein
MAKNVKRSKQPAAAGAKASIASKKQSTAGN